MIFNKNFYGIGIYFAKNERSPCGVGPCSPRLLGSSSRYASRRHNDRSVQIRLGFYDIASLSPTRLVKTSRVWLTARRSLTQKNGMGNKKDLPKGRSKSGGPGSNRQPLAWKAKALPLSYRREQVQLYKNWPVFKGYRPKVVGKILESC